MVEFKIAEIRKTRVQQMKSENSANARSRSAAQHELCGADENGELKRKISKNIQSTLLMIRLAIFIHHQAETG